MCRARGNARPANDIVHRSQSRADATPLAAAIAGGNWWSAAGFGLVATSSRYAGLTSVSLGRLQDVSELAFRRFRRQLGGYRSRYNTTSTQGESQMKIKNAAAAVAATAAMFALGAVPPAWATSNIQVMGVAETLKDVNGPLIGYTVTGLMPSSDPVPYPVAGQL